MSPISTLCTVSSNNRNKQGKCTVPFKESAFTESKKRAFRLRPKLGPDKK
ncbi:5214_t:CDS:2, partial [Funneliformis caledonium]